MAATEERVEAPPLEQLAQRVVGEYREMPGLILTLDQATRLWGCDADTCRRVAETLVQRCVLRWSDDGRLIRAE